MIRVELRDGRGNPVNAWEVEDASEVEYLLHNVIDTSGAYDDGRYEGDSDLVAGSVHWYEV